MDDDGNVKNSTLIVGTLVTLALLLLGTVIATTFLPSRFAYSGSVPALIFVLVFIRVHRKRRAGRWQ